MHEIEIETNVSRRHRARLARRRDLFVMLPYPALLGLSAALNNAEMAVVAYLAHEMWKLRAATVLLPSLPFRQAGFSKDAKNRALRRLEQAGAVQVTRRRRHSPHVKLTFRVYADR
jgi:hypothetical protein